MSVQNKTFDCVEMKRQAQARIVAEFESRRVEFASFAAFIEAKASETPWQREFWDRVRAARGEKDRR